MKNLLRGLTTNVAQLDRHDSDPQLRPQVVSGTVTEVADRLAREIQELSGWSIETREAVDTTIQIHATRRTRIFRFVDDIHIRIEPDAEGQSIVHAKSQSRVGKGDLGQNRRNLQR